MNISSKEEISSMQDVYTECTFSVFKSIVEHNILEPNRLGAKFCDFDIMMNLNTILAKQNLETITWEEQYRVDYTLRQLVCYRFLFHFGLTESEQKDFRQFVQTHEDSFNDYYQSACDGFNERLKEWIEKYPVLKNCYPVISNDVRKQSSYE